MSPNTAVRPRPAGRGQRALALPWDVIAGVVIAAVVTIPLSRGPKFIPRVNVVNPSGYTLMIDASGADGGRTDVAVVPPRSTTLVQHVIDHGDLWVFHARGQGADGGRFQVHRSDLARAGWRVLIPTAVEGRLRAAGAPANPGF